MCYAKRSDRSSIMYLPAITMYIATPSPPESRSALQHLRKEAHIGTGTNILCHRLKISKDTNCADIATHLHTRHREHGREQYQPEHLVR